VQLRLAPQILDFLASFGSDLGRLCLPVQQIVMQGGCMPDQRQRPWYGRHYAPLLV
jgi:hypothetical protein